MKYTFIENKYNNEYNKHKLFEYDQLDDENDDDDDVENIDQEKIELMSYICNDIEQLFDKLFNEDNSLEEKEKYIKMNKRFLNKKRHSSTLLIPACGQGKYDIVRLLLENGADPNIKDSLGDTALWYACYRGFIGIVKLLLMYGADPNIQGKYGSTVLQCASNRHYVKIVELLLKHGAEQSRTELISACGHGYTEIVKLLLENGADPNIRDSDGNIALRYAKKRNDTEIINLLLKYGAEE